MAQWHEDQALIARIDEVHLLEDFFRQWCGSQGGVGGLVVELQSGIDHRATPTAIGWVDVPRGEIADRTTFSVDLAIGVQRTEIADDLVFGDQHKPIGGRWRLLPWTVEQPMPKIDRTYLRESSRQ